jgi:hypothetical protein
MNIELSYSTSAKHFCKFPTDHRSPEHKAVWSPQQHQEFSNTATGNRSPQHSNVEREFSNKATQEKKTRQI